MFEDKLFKQKVAHSFDLAKRDIYALSSQVQWLVDKVTVLESENLVLRGTVEQLSGEMLECKEICRK